MKTIIPEAVMETESLSRATEQPALWGTAKGGGGGLSSLVIDRNLRNKFLPMLVNQPKPPRNQEWAKEALGLGRRGSVGLSGQLHFCFFFMGTCVMSMQDPYLLQAAPRVLSAQRCGKEWKLLFTRNPANGLMRIFHDSWMFVELKAFETRFQG